MALVTGKLSLVSTLRCSNRKEEITISSSMSITNISEGYTLIIVSFFICEDQISKKITLNFQISSCVKIKFGH